MAPRNAEPDFPLLKLQGLMATAITGDGNCLFNACSDQLYGHEGENFTIRTKVIDQMRNSPDDYKPFITANSAEGGIRRNPKRKNTKAPQGSFRFVEATPAQVEAAFQDHLSRMSKSGCWADNPEIVAFSRAYDTDVRIFMPTGISYYIRAAEDGVTRPVVYIALHSYEHYSSIRNIKGPYSPDLPEIKINSASEKDVREEMNQGPTIQQWQIEAIRSSLPTPPEEIVIRRAIKDANGDIDRVLSEMLDAQYYSSTPGTPGSLSESGSSSVERDHSDDDEDTYTNKRQNRRMSKVSKALRKAQRDRVCKSSIIPHPETTKHDGSTSRRESPDIPVLQEIRNANDTVSVGTSDEDTNSECTTSASSRAQSVALGTPPSRPRIILRTASQKEKLERQRQQASSSQETPPPESQPAKKTAPSKSGKTGRKLITAREHKQQKKAAQKKASKERKREKSQAGNTLTKSNTKMKINQRDSPPMDKVLSINSLSVKYV